MTKILVTLPPGTYHVSPAVRVQDPPPPAQFDMPVFAEHFDLDEACAQARGRITEYVNRAAGQHLRAMRNNWSQS